MRLRAAAFLVLLAGVMAPAVFAHPPVFIDNRMTVLFEGGKLEGIIFRWTFDEIFSDITFAAYKPATVICLFTNLTKITSVSSL